MKKNIVLLTLACIVAHVSFAQQQFKDPSSNIIQYKEYKNSVEYSFQAAVSLLHQATNGIYKNGEWKLINESTDKLNQTHYKFQLYYNDAIVLYHRYTVHVENGKVKSLSGDASGEALPVKSNGISEKEGLSAVLQVLNGRTYMWEDTASEQHLKLEQNDAHATYYPKGTKVYLLAENQLKIAWQFTVYAKEPLFKKTVIIDATNKNILATFEDLHDVSVAGTAVTKYSGTQTIEVDSLSPTNFILHDQTRGNGIRTWDLNTATSYNNAQDFTDTDNYWNNFNAKK